MALMPGEPVRALSILECTVEPRAFEEEVEDMLLPMRQMCQDLQAQFVEECKKRQEDKARFAQRLQERSHESEELQRKMEAGRQRQNEVEHRLSQAHEHLKAAHQQFRQQLRATQTVENQLQEERRNSEELQREVQGLQDQCKQEQRDRQTIEDRLQEERRKSEALQLEVQGLRDQCEQERRDRQTVEDWLQEERRKSEEFQLEVQGLRDQCKEERHDRQMVEGRLQEQCHKCEELQSEAEGLRHQTEAVRARLKTTEAWANINQCRWQLASLQQEEHQNWSEQLEHKLEGAQRQARAILGKLEMKAIQMKERRLESAAALSAEAVEDEGHPIRESETRAEAMQDLGPRESCTSGQTKGLLDLDLSELGELPSPCGLELRVPGGVGATEPGGLGLDPREEPGELPMPQPPKGAEEQRRAQLLGDPPQPHEVQHLSQGTSQSLAGEPQLPLSGRRPPQGELQPLHESPDLPQPLQQPWRLLPDASWPGTVDLQLQQEQSPLPPQEPPGEQREPHGQLKLGPGEGSIEPEYAKGVGVWCAQSHSSPLLDRLALREEPSRQSSIVGWVFLERPFIAEPAQKGWLRAIVQGGYLECDFADTNVVVRREERPSRTCFTGDAAMSLKAANAIDRLLVMEALPPNSCDNELLFWKILSLDSTAPGIPPLLESGEPAPHLRTIPSGSLVLGRKDGDMVRLEDWEGEPLYLERLGSEGEPLLEPTSTPLEILGPGTSIVAPKSDEPDTLARVEGVARMALPVEGRAKELVVEELSTSSHEPGGLIAPERLWKVSVPEHPTSYTLAWDGLSAGEAGQDLVTALPLELHQARAIRARAHFAEHRLAQRRTTLNANWHLEEMSPEEVLQGEDLPERLGAFLAKVHKVGTDWFDEWRDLTCEFYHPWAWSLDDECWHFWEYACIPGAFTGLDEHELQEWARQASFKPRSKAGQRIVTCHGGELHGMEHSSLQVRDARCSCVAWAAADLLRLTDFFGYSPSHEEPCCRAFHRYLSEWGDLDASSEAEDVVTETLEDALNYRKVRESLKLFGEGGGAGGPRGGGAAAGGAGGAGGGGGHGRGAAGTRGGGGIRREGAKRGGVKEARTTMLTRAAERSFCTPHSRLEALGGGRLFFWRVTLRHGHDLNPEDLGLFRQPGDSSPFSFLPLHVTESEPQRVVLGWEVPDSSEFLLVKLEGAAPLYLSRASHKGPASKMRSSSVVVERMEGTMPQLMGQGQRLIATVDMTPVQRAALIARRSTAAPRWWVVKAAWGVSVREEPYQKASRLTGKRWCKQDEIVLGKQLPEKSEWVELIHPTWIHDSSSYKRCFMCRYHLHQNKTVLMRPLEGKEDQRRVLLSWDSIEETERQLADAAMTAPGEFEKIRDSTRDLGEITSKVQSNGHSVHETVKLTFRRRWRADLRYVLHYDRIRLGTWIPAILARLKNSTAREVFAADFFSPKPIREGPFWHLEEDAGVDLASMLDKNQTLDLATVQQLARRIAQKDRQLSTGWFADFRRLLRGLVPELRDAPEGSHVWWRVAFKDVLLNIDPDARQAWANWRFEPFSKYSKRLVTCHGDLHFDFGPKSNVLVNDGKLMFIDHEASCVTWAVEDLARAIQPFCTRGAYSPSTRREFVRAYLEEISEEVITETDIDDLMFDLRRYRIVDKLYRKQPHPNIELMEEVYRIVTDPETRDTYLAADLRREIITASLSGATELYMQKFGKSSSLAYSNSPRVKVWKSFELKSMDEIGS